MEQFEYTLAQTIDDTPGLICLISTKATTTMLHICKTEETFLRCRVSTFAPKVYTMI